MNIFFENILFASLILSTFTGLMGWYAFRINGNNLKAFGFSYLISLGSFLLIAYLVKDHFQVADLNKKTMSEIDCESLLQLEDYCNAAFEDKIITVYEHNKISNLRNEIIKSN